MGRIDDPKLNELCDRSKETRRWAVKRFKEIGAAYTAGSIHLYGCWSFGLPDLHWHHPDARLGSTGQSPEEMYRETLERASEALIKQSLEHERALADAKLPNWIDQIEGEIIRRKGLK